MKTHKRTPQVAEPPKGYTYVLPPYVAADQIVFCTVCKLQFGRHAVDSLGRCKYCSGSTRR